MTNTIDDVLRSIFHFIITLIQILIITVITLISISISSVFMGKYTIITLFIIWSISVIKLCRSRP